jgi:hypothetical protein
VQRYASCNKNSSNLSSGWQLLSLLLLTTAMSVLVHDQLPVLPADSSNPAAANLSAQLDRLRLRILFALLK